MIDFLQGGVGVEDGGRVEKNVMIILSDPPLASLLFSLFSGFPPGFVLV